MGNNNSSTSSSSRRSSVTRELEKYTKPTGLYPTCPWEPKAARRMIMEKKIAPRFPGREAKESCFTQECPICFMYYPGNLNVSTCCKKPICSECFLQMKPPKKMICCPFCNHDTFGIKYTAPAVIELSSIYSERSSAPELSKPVAIPAVNREERSVSQHYASVEDRQKLRDDLRSQLNIAVGPITTPPPVSAVAVEDALMYASPADASRLEELMIMEAIRRSMYDANVAAKNTENIASTTTTVNGNTTDTSSHGNGLQEDELGIGTDRLRRSNESDIGGDGITEADYQYSDSDSDGMPLTPSQVHLSETRHSSSAVRRSSNPFDDDFDAFSGSSDLQQQQQQPTSSPSSSSSRSRNPDWNPFHNA